MDRLRGKLAALLLVAGIALALVSGNAVAQIYKCENKSGKIVFSDKACGDKSELVETRKFKKSKSSNSRPFFCPSGITAVVNNLNYPTLKSTDEAIRLAESDFTNLRYRKLIKKVDPSDELPDRVSKIRAEAFLASEVPGFSNGVVVNLKICK